MSMTVDDMKNIVITFVNIAEEQLDEKSFREMDNAGVEILKALDELEQYEAIGTVKIFETVIKSQMEYFNRMREYEKIGTVSEFRENKNFLEFLYNAINPNEMEQYLAMYHASEMKGE